MSPQAMQAFANNNGGVPLPKDKKQQPFSKEFQPGKMN
jgi:hypothetical protein